MAKSIWIINQFAGTPVSGWGERHFYLSKPLVDAGERIVIVSSGNNHMFNRDLKLKKLFTYEKYENVEFFWVWIPPYNPKNVTRFFSMFFFALSVLMLPFHTKKLGYPKTILLSSMSIFPLPSVLYIKRILGVKRFVFEVRDLWPLTPIYLMGVSKFNPLIVLIGFLEKWSYRSADSIISVFDESRSHINHISGNPDKFNWIPNGLNHEFLKGGTTPLPDQIAKKLPDNKLICCYAGTVGYANAMEPFFEVIGTYKEELHNIFFLIVGDGYLLPKYRAKVKNCKNVFFTGKLKKELMPTILKEADVCFISWHESPLYQYGVSANKYFDYLGAGKPVLSAQTNITDPVVKSGAGIVVKNGNEEILAGLIAFEKMSDQERMDLGQRGLDYVTNNHLYKDLSDKFLKVLEG